MDIIYHSMTIIWKIKMIEQGFNHADSTIKEISDFFKIGVENLEPKEDKKNLQQLPRNPSTRKSRRNATKQTPAAVLSSQVKNILWNIDKSKNSIFYTENAAIIWTKPRTYICI